MMKISVTKRFCYSMAVLLIMCLVCSLSDSYGHPKNDILLIVHDREISEDEFLYHLRKSSQDISQENIREYLESYIDFQLKLAQAREERIHQTIPFINELTEYRSLLAAPYLTDKEKEGEFVREASERLEFEANADEILVRLGYNAGPEDTLKAYAKAMQIRDRILNGESLGQISASVSGDPDVTINPENPGYFTAFEKAYPIESAVYHMKPGELSFPLRLGDGYHILRLIDIRKITGGPKSEEEIRKLIYDAKDERTLLIQGAFVEKLKKYWDFNENLTALEMIVVCTDERVLRGDWIPQSDRRFDETIFTIDDKIVKQKDFIEFMTEFAATTAQTSVREYIHTLYQKFVSSRLITYENYKLEEKHPEFRFQLNEYRDAMLLLAITREKVWLKAQSDTAGLKAFHDENRDRYMWGERLSASIFATDNEPSARKGGRMVSRSFRKGETDVREIVNQINEKTAGTSFTAEQGIYSKGDSPVIDQIKWKKGLSGTIFYENKYQFVFLHDILEPEYKSMDEAYDHLLDDYQGYLMKEWIDTLHSSYDVRINEALLKAIIDDYL